MNRFVYLSTALLAVGMVCLVFAGCGESSSSDGAVRVVDDDESNSDDDGRNEADVRAIDEAVEDYNAAQLNSAEAICGCYADETHDGDEEECQTETPTLIDLSACNREAALCDVDSYTSLLGCYETALEEFESCLAECPTGQGYTDCNDAYEERWDACPQHISDTLRGAMEQCEDGESPSCEASADPSSNDTDDEPTVEECREEFKEVVASESHWGESFDGTADRIEDGELVYDCECGNACAYVVFKVNEDGTYWQQWLQDSSYCNPDSSLGGIDVSGAWEVVDCETLRLQECTGETHQVPWELDDGTLHVDLPWNIDGHSFELNTRLEAGRSACCSTTMTEDQCE